MQAMLVARGSKRPVGAVLATSLPRLHTARFCTASTGSGGDGGEGGDARKEGMRRVAQDTGARAKPYPTSPGGARAGADRGGYRETPTWRTEGARSEGQRDKLRSPYSGFAGRDGRGPGPKFGSERRGPRWAGAGAGANARAPTRRQHGEKQTAEPEVKPDILPYDPMATKPLTETTKDEISMFHFVAANKNPSTFGVEMFPLLTDNNRKFKGLPLMVREPFVKVLDHLRGIKETPASKALYLDGKPGSGRSTIVAHTVHAARELEWLTLYVPRLFRCLDRSHYLIDDPRLEKTADGLDRYDQPDSAKNILESFREMNRHLLKQIPLTQIYALGKREIKTKEDTNLLELVGFGIDNYLAACDVLKALLQELRCSKRPVLVAVDEFNGMFYERLNLIDKNTVEDPTKFKVNEVATKWKYCRPHQMNVIRYFAEIFADSGKLSNGVAIAAASSTGHLLPFHKRHRPMSTVSETEAAFKHWNLEQMGIAESSVMERIQVPAFERTEIEALMNYYRSTKWVNWAPSKISTVELAMMTASNPKALAKMCDTL